MQSITVALILATLPVLAPADARPNPGRAGARMTSPRKPAGRVLLVARTGDAPRLSPGGDSSGSIDPLPGVIGTAWVGVSGKVEFIDREKGLVRVGTTVVRVTPKTEFSGFSGRPSGLEGLKVADRVTAGGSGGGDSLTADEIRLEADR